MSQRSLLAPLVLFLVIDASVCATTSSTDSPNFTLSIPPSFSTSVTVRHYRKGEAILNSPPYRLTTAAPMTEYHAWFGPRVAKQADNHWWAIRVYAHFSPKAATAYASATDGFQADLNEGPEFLGSAERSYMFARFERKHFRWGNAVSFFSQSTQDTMYVPNNGHLMYEVWGVTWNRQCTVVASVGSAIRS